MFKGEKQDHIGAREHILKMYMQQNPDPDRSCYSHFTVATGYLRFERSIAANRAVCFIPSVQLAPPPL